MALSLVEKQVSTNDGASFREITFTNTPQADDVVIVIASGGNDISSWSPTVTEKLGNADIGFGFGGRFGSIAYRRCTGSEGTTWRVTYTGNEFSGCATFQLWRGAVMSGDPLEVATVGSTDFNATITAPSITTLTDDAAHIAVFFQSGEDYTDEGNPTGYTDGGHTERDHMSSYKIIATAGSTGAQSITGDTTDQGVGVSLSLKPAAGGSSNAPRSAYYHLAGGLR